MNAKSIIQENCDGVEIIVLFGSYARGDWVEDVYEENRIVYEHKNHFDVLVVTERINRIDRGELKDWILMGREIIKIIESLSQWFNGSMVQWFNDSMPLCLF